MSIKRSQITAECIHPSPGSGHMLVLDGFRGIAILLVLMHHFGGSVLPDSHSTLAAKLLAKIYAAGWIGVEMFFVLSGFLITTILLRAKANNGSLTSFFGRRVLRIFPLYYLFLVLFLAVFPAVFPEQTAVGEQVIADQAYYWSYLNNFYMIFILQHWAPYNCGHLWSLAVEEQFYIFWPFCVYFLGSRKLACLTIFIICASPFARFGTMVFSDSLSLSFAGATSTTSALFANYLLTPLRMDGLAAGSLIALAARRSYSLKAVLPLLRVAVVMAFCVLSVLLIMLRGNFSWLNHSVQLVGFTLLSALFGSLIVFCLTCDQNNVVRRSLESPVLRFFGKYSYSMYIFHMPLIVILDRYGLSEIMARICPNPYLRSIWYVAMMTIVTSGIALITWHLLEKRFLSLKSFFPTVRTA
jgi:peptidoglycan/LPS O-acetylase OafA/YrhL